MGARLDVVEVRIMVASIHDGSLRIPLHVWQVPETLPIDVLGKMHAPPKSSVPIIDVSQLPDADGFLFGFPTWYGMMPAQFKAFIDATGSLWRSQALAGKPAGIFVSTGGQGGGQETTAWVLVLLLPPMHIYIQFCHHLPAEVSCTVFFLKSGWPLKQTS